jgi:phage shock protein E
MKIVILALFSQLCYAAIGADPQLPADATSNIPNPLINYPAFMSGAAEVGRLRVTRRITEERFIELANEAETVILDARSAEKYAEIHVKGAKHLNFSDITADSLARVIPSKVARVLIYCNNNFQNAPDAFPSKVASASLNIHTFNTLFSYGYTNVYELGPLIDVRKTKLTLEAVTAPRSR